MAVQSQRAQWSVGQPGERGAGAICDITRGAQSKVMEAGEIFVKKTVNVDMIQCGHLKTHNETKTTANGK